MESLGKQKEIAELLDIVAAEEGYSSRYELVNEDPGVALQAIENRAFGGDRDATVDFIAERIMPEVVPVEER